MKKIIANISRVFTIALVVISAALLVAGCTKSTETDVSGIEDDIRDLKERVASLEDLTAALDQKIEAKTSITEIESGTDGHTIHFSNGTDIFVSNGSNDMAGITPLIEARTDGSLCVNGNELPGVDIIGMYGNSGTVPRIEVRQSNDGSLSVWFMAEGDWADSGVEIAAPHPSNPLKFIIINEFDGTVTLTLNDTENTEYIFMLTWAAITDIEIVPTRPVEFTGSDTKEIAFLVSPSTARIPTGTGDAVKQWSIMEAARYTTRAIAPSELFTVAGIRADGNGEYTATVVCNAAKHDFDIAEYVMTLALNTNTGTNQYDDMFYYSETFGVCLKGDLFVSVPSSLIVDPNGETLTVDVLSASAWTVATEDAWFTVQKTGDSFTVTASKNTDTTERTGRITVTNGTSTKQIEVSQPAYIEMLNMGLYRDNGATYGAGTDNFLMFFQDYVPTNTTNDEGWQLQLNFVTPSLDRGEGKRYIDLPAGTYRISREAVVNSIYSETSSLGTVMWGGNVYSDYFESGTVTVEGDHNGYTITFDLTLENGTEFIGKYVGPYLWENKRYVNPDFSYEDLLGRYTATGKPVWFTDAPGASTWSGEIRQGPSTAVYTITNAFNTDPENLHPIAVYPSGEIYFDTNVVLGELTVGRVYCIAGFEDDEGGVHFLDRRATIPLAWDPVARTLSFPEKLKINGNMGMRKMMYGMGMRNDADQVSQILSDDLYEDLVFTIAPAASGASLGAFGCSISVLK